MEGSERRGLGTVIRNDDVTEKETDSTDKRVTETACGVDLDGDGGGIAGKKLRRDAEEKLVVPGGVVAADGVETSAEAVQWVDPCDGVGLFGMELAGGDLETLGRDEVDLQDGHVGGRKNPVSGNLHG